MNRIKFNNGIFIKRCSKCGNQQPLNEFSKSKTSKDFHRYYCKKCDSVANKQRFQNYKERMQRRKQSFDQDCNQTHNKFPQTKMRTLMRQWLKRTLREAPTEDPKLILGYTEIQLMQRLECQFKEGMSWGNHGEWHIDHRKPISAFKEGTDPKIVNMLGNLQPLWAKENLKKNDAYKVMINE